METGCGLTGWRGGSRGHRRGWRALVQINTLHYVVIDYRLGPSPDRTRPDAPTLSAQRAVVLEALQRRGTPVAAAALASELGLHVNTVREHLDALVRRALALRARGPVAGRGRPAWAYQASDVGEPDSRVRDYAGLAAALASHLARNSPDPAAEAERAGRAWGAKLVEDDGRPPPRSGVQARRRVVELLARSGFSPEADAQARVARLRRCPLLDVARAHPEIVCTVHLGLVRGALESMGVPAEGGGLTPFAEPGACLLTLPIGHQQPATP
jgi:predicted ArsR family transcriptional regulator